MRSEFLSVGGQLLDENFASHIKSFSAELRAYNDDDNNEETYLMGMQHT